MKNNYALKAILIAAILFISSFVFACGNKTFTVRFFITSETDSVEVLVAEGEKVTPPITPEKDGAIFLGWFSDADYNTASDFDTPVTSDLDVYAKWENASVTFRQDYNTFMETKEGDHKISLERTFDFSPLFSSSAVLSKELATLSLFATLASDEYVGENNDYTEGYKNLERFYLNLGLQDLYFNDGYKTRPSEESLGFGIGRKTVNGVNVVIFTVRSWNYGNEWQSNLDIGTTGEHKGFSAAKDIAFSGLCDYLSSRFTAGEKIKLLIAGYSRGGAVANLLGAELDDRTELGDFPYVEKNDLFVYCFNAPAASVKQNDTTKYDNVFVIYSSEDFVTFLTDVYGFNHLGVKIDVFNQKIYGYAAQNFAIEINDLLPAEISFNGGAALVPKDADKLESMNAAYKDLLSSLTFTSKRANAVSIETRDKYVENLYPHVKYFVGLIMDEKPYVAALINAFSDFSFTDFAELMTNKKGWVAEKIKAEFISRNLPFDGDALYSACEGVQNFIYSAITQNLAEILPAGATFAYNLNRLIVNHSLEGFCFILENYFA